MADVERSHVDSHRERLFHTRACLKDMAGSCRALGSRAPRLSVPRVLFLSFSLPVSREPCLPPLCLVCAVSLGLSGSVSRAPSLSLPPSPSRAIEHARTPF